MTDGRPTAAPLPDRPIPTIVARERAHPTADASPRTSDAEPAAGLVPDHVRRLAWFLDDALPFLGGRRIGADGFLSFIPVVGDAAGFALAAVVVLSGVRAGASWATVARMTFHAVGESLAGMIPVLGPVIAFAWKANQRNLRIIEADLVDREATRRESWKVLLVALLLVCTTIALITISFVVFLYAIWRVLTGS